MSASAGWYQDPSQADQLRYWDGQQWTQHTHAAPPQSSAPQSFAPEPTAPEPESPASSTPSATPHESGSFATPASVQANPVSGMTPGAAPSYAGGQQSYTPTPAFTGATPKKGLGTGAIVGIVVGAVALVGIIGVLAAVGLGSLANDSVAGDATPTVSESDVPDDATTAEDPVVTDDPTATVGSTESADIPAAFSVPDGWVEVRHDDVSVAYGVPAEWYDISDLYAPIFGSEPQEISGEVVTFLSAWSKDSGDGLGSTDVMILHSKLPTAYGTELYSVGARKGFASTAGGTSWTDPVTYTNDAGVSVTVSTGTPTVPDTYVSTDMYVIGGGTSMVLVECVAYDQTGNCDGVESAVATMWVG